MNENIERIPRGEDSEIKLILSVEHIKITDRDGTKRAKKVSIRFTREEVRKICEAVNARQNQDSLTGLQSSDPFDLLFEEREV